MFILLVQVLLFTLFTILEFVDRLIKGATMLKLTKPTLILTVIILLFSK